MSDERAIRRPTPTCRAGVVVAAIGEGELLDAIDAIDDATIAEYASDRSCEAR